MAIAGLILGIVALVSWLLPFGSLWGIILAIVALVLSVKGKNAAIAAGKGSGVGTAGMIIGIIAVVLTGIMFFACGLCSLCALCAGGAVNGAINGAVAG